MLVIEINEMMWSFYVMSQFRGKLMNDTTNKHFLSENMREILKVIENDLNFIWELLSICSECGRVRRKLKNRLKILFVVFIDSIQRTWRLKSIHYRVEVVFDEFVMMNSSFVSSHRISSHFLFKMVQIIHSSSLMSSTLYRTCNFRVKYSKYIKRDS